MGRRVQVSGSGDGCSAEAHAQRLVAIIDAGELAFPLREVTPEPAGP